MPPTCTVTECRRPSCALCHCCQQDVCLSHLKEHQNQLISRLNPLVDQTNILETRLKGLDIDTMTSSAREKLEQWRNDCYKMIDNFFEKKSQELTRYASEKLVRQREEIDQMQSKLTDLIHEQVATREEIDSLQYKLNNFEKEINKTEQTSFEIKIQTAMINDDLIVIKESNPDRFDLSSLSTMSKTINCSKDNYSALATNDRFLLMYQKPNLCLLDQEFTIIKKSLWSFGEIWDMFWSSVLERFIVINTNSVFLIDVDTISIESIQMVAKQNWCCGTCSDKSLFLASYKRGSSIMEFNLLPSIEFVKQWKSPETCSKDEGIHDIIYNNNELFLIIENRIKRTVRVELRSSITLDHLWSLQLDSANNQNVQIRCCLFNYHEWIVANHDTGRLLHITKDGKLKTSCSYTPAPHFASTFGSNLLIVATSNSINLHKF